MTTNHLYEQAHLKALVLKRYHQIYGQEKIAALPAKCPETERQQLSSSITSILALESPTAVIKRSAEFELRYRELWNKYARNPIQDWGGDDV